MQTIIKYILTGLMVLVTIIGIAGLLLIGIIYVPLTILSCFVLATSYMIGRSYYNTVDRK